MSFSHSQLESASLSHTASIQPLVGEALERLTPRAGGLAEFHSHTPSFLLSPRILTS